MQEKTYKSTLSPHSTISSLLAVKNSLSVKERLRGITPSSNNLIKRNWGRCSIRREEGQV
jgi:hypothetical protein